MAKQSAAERNRRVRVAAAQPVQCVRSDACSPPLPSGHGAHKRGRAHVGRQQVAAPGINAAILHSQRLCCRSEGQRASAINNSEGERQAMINMAEGRAKQIVLEADARAKAIELAAEAQKAALSQYVQAGLSPAEASRLTIALRYVELLPAVLQVRDLNQALALQQPPPRVPCAAM
jgi:hypothetical protein